MRPGNRIGKTLGKLLRSQTGGALIETAVTAPLLTLLLVGAVEFARVAYTAIEVSNAARAAVSYGAQNGGTASDTSGITWVAAHDGANVSSLQVTKVAVSYVCSDGSPATGKSTDCKGSHIEELLTVNTQASMDPLVHVPGMPNTYTVYGKAAQKCLQ